MFAKKQSRQESEERQGRRINVDKLQRGRETVRELSSGEQKRVKGGVVISIIGVLIGSRSAPADQRQQ